MEQFVSEENRIAVINLGNWNKKLEGAVNIRYSHQNVYRSKKLIETSQNNTER
jgi:hypothetical protein